MSKTRMGKNRAWLADELLERGWELRDIGILYDRIIACLDAGEHHRELYQRLNPTKATTPAWTPQDPLRERLRASSGDFELQARLRRQRERFNV